MIQLGKKLIPLLYSSKTLYKVIGAFTLLYITVMAFYVAPPKVTTVTKAIFDIQWYIPLILFIPVYINKAFTMLDRIINIKTLNIICYLVLIGSITAHFFGIPGLWWSWMTIGLSFSILTLVVNITKDRLSSGEGFLLGCGCVLVIISFWEAFIYQFGLLVYHRELAFGSAGIGNYLKVVSWNMIWALQGLGIIAVIQYKYRKSNLINTNSIAKVCLAIFAIFTIAMYIDRFPTAWHNPEFNITMCIMRGSKAFFALGLATLFLPTIIKTKASFYDDQIKSPNPIRSWFHKIRHGTIKGLVLKYHNNNEQIADLGCGNCVWNKGLKLGVIGIGKDKEVIEYSIKQGRIQTGIIANLVNTTLTKNSIKTIVCSETLEHIQDYKAILLEIKRVLKPNGHLILSVPYDTIDSLWKPLFWLQCFYQWKIVGDKYYKDKCGHINHFSPKSISTTVQQAGFEIIETLSPHRMTIFLVARKKL